MRDDPLATGARAGLRVDDGSGGGGNASRGGRTDELAHRGWWRYSTASRHTRGASAGRLDSEFHIPGATVSCDLRGNATSGSDVEI